MTGIDRRNLLMGGMGGGLGIAAAWPYPSTAAAAPAGALLNALDFGAAGDGRTDDTEALQRALDAAAARGNGGLLLIPPGAYRVSHTLRLETSAGPEGNVTHGLTIRAQGAKLISAVGPGRAVLELVSRAVVRFLTVEGLEIQGNGREGHGLVVSCVERGRYLYNFCLRDLVVQNCGGDGCRMTGNVFEGQIFNSYFRDNGGNGATFAHGPQDTVLSAVHAFGCVFGGNDGHGVAMADGAEDVGFQGCYFLLNGRFGLDAPHGCTLLSHCGFENNHRAAKSFDDGDAAVRLQVKGTLIGCTAYSIENQTHLLRAFVTNRLTLVGCTGGGGGKARQAGLAKLQGTGDAEAYLVGTHGRVDDDGGLEVVAMGPAAAGRFPSRWDDPRLARIGDYRLWVDAEGTLRINKGRPASDTDGRPVGA